MPIRKTPKGNYKIENVPGTHKTKKAAIERLKAVKANQKKKKK